jgi:DNA replication and repair protein RecF
MAVELHVSQLSIRGFRNLSRVEIEPSPRFNIIWGDNGQGKTSLLEALYFLCTSKSFRSERIGELRQVGSSAAVVHGQISEAGVERRQRASISSEGQQFVIDDTRATRLADYATRSPVVIFQPGDLQLIAGSASGRRKLLDRISLFLTAESMEHKRRFQRAQRERQRVLDTRGIHASDLDGYERVMARHGSELQRIRLKAAERLSRAAALACEQLADKRVHVALKFVPGGPYEEGELARQLAVGRSDDQRRRSTRIGPHKDELEIQLDQRLARRHASQGQQRILALALKIAELDCLREARGAFPLLLLDDVSSELDRERTAAVYELLRRSQSQIFLTTTRPELFDLERGNPLGRREIHLEQGAVSGA